MSQGAAVFIIYRRADAAGHAGRLHDRLKCWLDPEDVFYDLDHIEPRDDFPKRIQKAVSDAKVVLVLIAPNWLAELTRRATLSAVDWVRAEVGWALRLNAATGSPKVIPVLLGGAPPLTPSDLNPYPALRPLANLEAHELQGKNADWEHQFVRLCELIAGVPGVPVPRRFASRALVSGALSCVLLAIALGGFLVRSPQKSPVIERTGAPTLAQQITAPPDSVAITAEPQQTPSSEATAEPSTSSERPVATAPTRHLARSAARQAQQQDPPDPQDLDLESFRTLKLRY